MATLDREGSAAGDVANVCSLPADALRDRLALIRREILPHARDLEELPNGLAWAFEPGMQEKLEQLVELERQCCGGLEWRLETLEGSVGLRLVVEGAEPRSLFAVLAGPDGQPRRVEKIRA